MISSKTSFTIGEVAILREIPEKAVRRAIACGDLVAERYNLRCIRVTKASLEAWLALCRTRARSPAGRCGQK